MLANFRKKKISHLNSTDLKMALASLGNRRLSQAWLQKIQSPPSAPETKHLSNKEMILNWSAHQSTEKSLSYNEEAAELQHTKGPVSSELEQILIRVRVDKLMTEKTIDAQNQYLDGLEALLEELGDGQALALAALRTIRAGQRQRRVEYRRNPLYKAFPHLLRGDEHTNLFVQHTLTKCVTLVFSFFVVVVVVACTLSHSHTLTLSHSHTLSYCLLTLRFLVCYFHIFYFSDTSCTL